MATFGWRALLLFLRRRLSLDAAFAEVSEALGTRVTAVVMPQAEAAIDVDKMAVLTLVRQILETEASQEPNNETDQSRRSPSPTKPPLVAS